MLQTAMWPTMSSEFTKANELNHFYNLPLHPLSSRVPPLHTPSTGLQLPPFYPSPRAAPHHYFTGPSSSWPTHSDENPSLHPSLLHPPVGVTSHHKFQLMLSALNCGRPAQTSYAEWYSIYTVWKFKMSWGCGRHPTWYLCLRKKIQRIWMTKEQ